jgi:hypothetical protein
VRHYGVGCMLDAESCVLGDCLEHDITYPATKLNVLPSDVAEEVERQSEGLWGWRERL